MKSYIRYRQEGFIALATITSLLILALYETQQIHNTILKQSLGLLVLGAIAMEFIIGVKLITKEVKVTVSDTAIKIDVKKYSGNFQSFEYPFNTLESYKVIYASYRFNCIKLKPQADKEREYAFLSTMKSKDQTPTNEVVTRIKEAIFNYNKQHSNTIKLLSGFSATNKGLWLIICLFLIAVIVAFIHYLYFSQLPLFDVVLIIGIAGQLIRNRYVNNKIYEQTAKDEAQFINAN